MFSYVFVFTWKIRNHAILSSLLPTYDQEEKEHLNIAGIEPTSIESKNLLQLSKKIIAMNLVEQAQRRSSPTSLSLTSYEGICSLKPHLELDHCANKWRISILRPTAG